MQSTQERHYIPLCSEDHPKAVSYAFITVWVHFSSLNLEPRKNIKQQQKKKVH